MRLTQKKMEEIVHGILGEDGLPLLKELILRGNISEFDLATKLKKDIKLIRKMLYLLYNHNLVSFTRKKDKIKGWYVYYWTLLPENIRFSYHKKKRELMDVLKQRLDDERKELFFACPKRCIRLTFDQAMDFEFHCPECGELTIQDVTEEKVKALKEQIKGLEVELEGFKEVHRVQNIKVKQQKKVVKAKIKEKKATAKKKVAPQKAGKKQ